jgi:hypothetical protein
MFVIFEMRSMPPRAIIIDPISIIVKVSLAEPFPPAKNAL